MESGHWVQEQMSVTADFPFDAQKKIERGMRIAFRDPDTDAIEVFEVQVITNTEPDHYQKITAEHIALCELSDEHIDATEIDNKTAAQALGTALSGTLWSVGADTSSGTQSADFSRGSVWDAVNTIKQNWNVYITPRVVFSSAGAITGRYLDIAPAVGVNRGLRLSLRKNLLDPAVTYDDAEVYTALYGYGGSVDVPQASGDDVAETLTFADEVWTATADHPAKPSGQTYLEWPEKTALYGRNGRPRYGYYQNGSIKDSEVLLEKTWESLKQSCEPKINITGSCVDLYRLGYNDQPLRLHDIAIVEIEETGEVFQKQIICCDIDLIDPTGSRVEIGDYIANIVYITRDTTNVAETGSKSGGGGGGGGRGSMTNLEDDQSRYVTWFEKNDKLIGMFAGIKDGDEYIKVGNICVAINDSDDILANIKADHVNISATSTAHMLAGSIVYDEQGRLVLKESSGGGVYVERDNQGTSVYSGIWDAGNFYGTKIVQTINGDTQMTLKANFIDIQGLVNELTAYDVVTATFHSLNTIVADGEATFNEGIDMNGSDITGATNLDADNATFDSLTVDGDEATWQSYTARYCTLGGTYNFQYTNSQGTTSTVSGALVTGHTETTIHYLGY
jgi:phage minor structural protein